MGEQNLNFLTTILFPSTETCQPHGRSKDHFRDDPAPMSAAALLFTVERVQCFLPLPVHHLLVPFRNGYLGYPHSRYFFFYSNNCLVTV